VSAYNGAWFRTVLGSPTVALVEHLEKRVTHRQSAMRGTFVYYTIPRKGTRWTRELVSAERLLKLADMDYDLAAETIDLLFSDKQFNFKTNDSLMYLDKDFTLALAIVKAERAARAAKNTTATAAFERAIARNAELFD